MSLAKLKLLQLGLRLITEETEPDLTQVILETHLEHLEPHLTTKCQMVMEGVMSIQSGDHPLELLRARSAPFDFD